MCDTGLPQLPIAYMDIRFFAYATEDENKVVEAVQHILPADHIDEIMFERSNLRGHHGNPITFFETRINKKELMEAVLSNIASGLNVLDKETLLQEINLHTEKGNLYVRLDKQAAFQGEVKLCTADPIRLRVRFKKTKIEDIIEACRQIGMVP